MLAILRSSPILIFAKGFVLVLAMLYGASVSADEFSDSEPNNTCVTAQLLGELNLPSTVVGSLDSTPEIPDVDFFKFEGISGQVIVVDLEGASTGAGTLQDPYLGLFDSGCNLIAINDDTNGLNSRLNITVPENGVFVLGASNCCDFNFMGGGIGSYLLTLNQFVAINAIEGRLVNASTGDPLSGTDLPYANLAFMSCSDNGCFEFRANQQADSEGRFSFQMDYLGNPLSVGGYQIHASAFGFETLILDPFTVGDNETFNLGDLGLLPVPFVSAIEGRIVDAINGEPIPGNIAPYPYVYLERCEDYGCFIVGVANPDDIGNFLFNGINYNLNPGNYRLVGFANDYQQYTSAQFSAAAFEVIDIGDLPLTPLPIQFGTVIPCIIPTGGGTCEYGIDVTYRGLTDRYLGEAWSIIELYSPPNYRAIRFQVGKLGIRDANPQRLYLRQDQNETITFRLNAGESVPDGSTVCGYIVVGQKPAAQFNSQDERFIFCSAKQSGALVQMSEKEAHKQINKLKSKSLSSDKCISGHMLPEAKLLCEKAGRLN